MATEEGPPNKREGGKRKYRKEKPWDNENIDHWKVEKFTREDNKNHFLEESSFKVLFPKYREKYLQQFSTDIKNVLNNHFVKFEMNLIEGYMCARDMISLLSRSVPFSHAKRVLDDETFCDIIKISTYVRNKNKFIKRRQRLLGSNGTTLKALEILTNCYICVHGKTVSVIGYFKALKVVRRIIVDCMKNIHPVYHIKELIAKRELEKNEEFKNENWEKFLPNFKKRNAQRRKIKQKLDKKKGAKKEEKSVFPPDQLPRKIDIQMETGEYFMRRTGGEAAARGA
ncbi:RNA-binding protein [Plasmodium cynomolgi strain B]|uniref:KRR-R motif-containing protein 1 n=1 Tax=Plasmodium cynomolgi (strain B) TaxID=1120755 RepID=K6USQ9_PLACD|nr:RNA-binding protein [Plasmodium cynomolgi strain B]GAB65015.1 RNA-binding protein [Plasmodium cynomolgi strain B]